MDRIVPNFIGKLKKVELNIVMKTNSKAEEIFFTIEFKYLRKKLVIMPANALLKMIRSTWKKYKHWF